MAFSIGTDLVKVQRIAKSILNPRFLARIYTKQEISYCRDKAYPAQHFAVRFAAKEAVWKALSDLDVQGIGHKEIGVQRSASGKPSVSLSPRLKKYEKYISLSLSHTKDHALAVAFFQNRP